jgi:hypothetical protein
MKNALFLFALLLGLVACSPAAATPAPSVTPLPTATKTPAPSPTPTQTEIPTPTIEKPSPASAGFRNPVNAASEVFEGEVWYLKNVAGLPTAKWNAETKNWDTKGYEANITRTQVFVGNEVDQSYLAPFLGSLPPDDPTTYFKDVNGYGIGPEITIETTGTNGMMEIPTTEIFVRYRGTVVIPSQYGSKYDRPARIFEIPLTDTSIIIVTETLTTKEFHFTGSLGDSAVYNQYLTNSEGHKLEDSAWKGVSGIQIANAKFIGKMGAMFIFHDTASLFPAGSDAQAEAAVRDTYAASLIAYISGTSNQAPIPIPFSYQKGTGIGPDLMFPEINLPK